MKHKELRTIQKVDTITTGITCDVCKKRFDTDNHILELQEFTSIRHMGGYGSVFGDECTIELDICQHCLKEKLGEFIIVKDCELPF